MDDVVYLKLPRPRPDLVARASRIAVSDLYEALPADLRDSAVMNSRIRPLIPGIRMAGSAVHGEDVLQDTLVKALQARAEGAEVGNLEGWLFRIAHNTSLDFVRARSRSAVVPLTEDIAGSSAAVTAMPNKLPGST